LAIKGNVAFVDSSLHVFRWIDECSEFHHSNLRRN
jgi:hypothetical protein